MRFALLLPSLLALAATDASAADSLLRIRGTGCPGVPSGSLRTSTGFRIAGRPGVYTALHGVLGCKSIDATAAPSGTEHTNLVIESADVAHDIAYLASAMLPADPNAGYAEASGSTATGAQLTVVGYPFGLNTALKTALRARDPATVKLRALIPPTNVFFALQARASPGLDTDVISVEGGHLLPGHSGAPVLNAAGKLVGVANGGLERGAVEISWVVPWKDVKLVAITTVRGELDRVLANGDEALFALEHQPPVGISALSCFGLTLRPVKVLGINELMATVDDPPTYQAVISTYGLFDSVQSFVVFRSEAGEVTLVVPEGWDAQTENAGCRATSPNGQVTLRYEFYTQAPGAAFALLNTKLLEREADEFCDRGYIIDPTTSNWAARPSLQRGILSMRKHFMAVDRRCGRFNDPVYPFNGQTPETAGWVTLPSAPHGPRGTMMQCQPIPCSGTPTYPDVWVPFAATPFFVEGWGFASYVGSQKRALFTWARWKNDAFPRRLIKCVNDLSVDASCEQLYSQQRTWAVGVIAATASVISK